jgi:hypothetical protein
MNLLDKEMWRLIGKVVISWQVIAITLFFLLYIQLVGYVAKLYHPKRKNPIIGRIKQAAQKPKPPKKPPAENREKEEEGEEEEGGEGQKKKKKGLGAKLKETFGKKKQAPAPEEDDEPPQRPRRK